MMLAVLAASAQSIELESDTTALQPCLDVALCAGPLQTAVSGSIRDLGYMLQHDTLSTSALSGRGTGLIFELRANTFAVGSDNIIIEEVNPPPILPRVEVGYQFGSFTFDDPFPQFSVSLHALPPVKVGERSFGQVGGTLGAAVPVYEHLLWTGLEAGVGYGSARGELLGNGEVLGELQTLTELADLPPPPCDSTPVGCVDRFRQTTWTARAGVHVDPHPAIFAYTKLGVAYVDTRLDIAYDDTKWSWDAVQPQWSYGLGVRIEDRVGLTVAGVTALTPGSVDGASSITRVAFGISVRTGDKRYWFDEAEAPPEP